MVDEIDYCQYRHWQKAATWTQLLRIHVAQRQPAKKKKKHKKKSDQATSAVLVIRESNHGMQIHRELGFISSAAHEMLWFFYLYSYASAERS